MRAGKARERIEIDRPEETSSESGALTRTWKTVCQAWAERLNTSMATSRAQDQLRATVVRVYRIRYAPGIDHTCRVRCPHESGREFLVVEVVDVDGRRNELLVTCAETSPRS